MRQFFASMVLCGMLASSAFAQTGASAFAGRWNFNITTPRGTRASWLGIKDKGGALEVWYQPTGGNVIQLADVKTEGQRLILTLNQASGNRPATSWELEAHGDKLTGVQRRGSDTTEIAGVRAPELKRPMPQAWSKPEPLFNGKDLTGWEPVGDPAGSRWKVIDGLLVNTDVGGNLKTTSKFNDFKLHFEVNCPDNANSGVYLRGRYEIQIEYHPGSTAPPERRMASVYGRIAPKPEMPAKPGQWETFDVTFVGRTLTVARDGVTIIDRQEVEGITGGALDANEAEPGPFYIQGDHAGGIKFRNITVAVPK